MLSAVGRATPVRENMRESYAVGRALTFFSTAVRTLDLEVYSANLVSHPSERGPYRVPLLATEILSDIVLRGDGRGNRRPAIRIGVSIPIALAAALIEMGNVHFRSRHWAAHTEPIGVELIANPAPGAPVPPILPPTDGLLTLDKAKFAASFAADVEPSLAAFMAESQVPWGLDALDGAVTEAAWKMKPSWYLVATDDHMIPPDAQRFMSKRAGATVVESPGSHAVYVSRPEPVAKLIAQAASAVRVASR